MKIGMGGDPLLAESEERTYYDAVVGGHETPASRRRYKTLPTLQVISEGEFDLRNGSFGFSAKVHAESARLPSTVIETHSVLAASTHMRREQ
jgi:hypothetical protein